MCQSCAQIFLKLRDKLLAEKSIENLFEKLLEFIRDYREVISDLHMNRKSVMI